MSVLDLDLDFFLNRRAEGIDAREKRLSSLEFTPWTSGEVTSFLEDRCLLRRTAPTPGRVFVEHDEAFDWWKSLISDGRLRTPFNLVHIDAHADMGMGDPAYRYVMSTLLHLKPLARTEPPRTGAYRLRPGNFLLFALACRWVGSLTYVCHPDTPRDNCEIHDVPDCLFADNDPVCRVLQLKKLPSGFLDDSGARPEEYQPLQLEPPIPFELVEAADFQGDSRFAFASVAQSPRYTPPTADPLLDTIRAFLLAE